MMYLSRKLLKVDRIIRHELYNANSFENDIALLRIQESDEVILFMLYLNKDITFNYLNDAFIFIFILTDLFYKDILKIPKFNIRYFFLLFSYKRLI